MGNLCGKSSKNDSFSSPGRTLGSAPAHEESNAQTPIPNRATKPPPRVGGPDRTLGESSGRSTESGADPRSAAAKAAEARANAQSKGSLGQKLADQKRQTGNQALAQASREERGARNQDANAEARAYN